MRPPECVVCGGPKHTQRGVVCEKCQTPFQRAAWRRQKHRQRARRARALAYRVSAPVAGSEAPETAR